MIDRIIIAHLYQPGSAATNRIIAYARGFAACGVEVYLILGNHIAHEKPILENGEINIYMVQAPHGYKLNKAMANKVKDLYKGDSTAILIYGTPALCWFLPKSRYNIFYECTEIPFFGRKKTLITRIKETVKSFLERRATGMFVISQALSNYFAKQGIKNIAVINMFVDSKRFENIKGDTKEKYIAYCGWVSEFKDGVDSLIKAFGKFAIKHIDYKLYIIGDFISSVDEKNLRQLVLRLNLSDKVIFTGKIKPKDMPELLCGAQMLALARPDTEQSHYGFPTKLGEYLATGKPVIVTNVGEIGLFLKDGENCRMATPNNPDEFADRLSWVADNYKEALILGSAGRLLTNTEFSNTVQCKKALDFMREHSK